MRAAAGRANQRATLTRRPYPSRLFALRPASASLRDATIEMPASESHPVHADAVRRRREAEERHRQRLLELERAALGAAWWRQDPHCHVELMASQERLHDLIRNSDRLLVVNFFSEQCYSCKSLHPKLKKIAADHRDVMFVKVNGSNPAFESFFQAAGIKSVPWFHLYRGGQLLVSMSASLNPERLAAFRAQISAHKDPRMLA